MPICVRQADSGNRLRNLVYEAVTLGAIINAGLMSFMAFCAGEGTIMLCMRVWLSAVFVFGVSLFDHGVVVPVAGSTDAVVGIRRFQSASLCIHVTGCTFHASGYVPVRESMPSGS